MLIFGTAFLSAPFILQQIYGIFPGDPDFYIYEGTDGKPMTPYNNFLFNACLTAPFVEGNTTITMDTKGLEESGLFFYDPNTCFDMAKDTAESAGFIIDKIEPYKSIGDYGTEKDQMKITMVKK